MSLKKMDLSKLKSIFRSRGCSEIYLKKLSPNDNSKNQVYLGGSFEVLNIFPISNITTAEVGDWKKERFKASLNFYWAQNDGTFTHAPNAQLILYPKYPEVRFSGFLLGAENAPSKIMRERTPGRIMFFSVDRNGIVLGYSANPESLIANEVESISGLRESGVFSIIEINGNIDNKTLLLNEIYRIHSLGWINSKRLNSKGDILPCQATNCGGYTLEAELGITPNGFSEPDFLGWEIKQFGVANFQRIQSSRITLMTPEPTGGYYHNMGVDYFVRKYGYKDKSGRPDRLNFGGIHKINFLHPSTKLNMTLVGYDNESGKIRNSNGRISLIDLSGNEAASWSFSSMLLHWNRKHDKACYIPSIMQNTDLRKYHFGNSVVLGVGTDFQLFLAQMAKGNIFYDPGIKIEHASTKPKIKQRSQFRIKSENLAHLYKKNEIVNVLKQL